jgi:APA family basic amino acid/polyamine antiporter
MARNKQLPKSIAKVSSRFGTPYISILTMGALLTVLTFVLDLKQAAAITSFSLLCVHLAVNVSAINLRRRKADAAKFRVPLYPLIPSLGLVSCLILMFSLPQESWAVAAAVVIASAALYLLLTRKSERLQDLKH